MSLGKQLLLHQNRKYLHGRTSGDSDYYAAGYDRSKFDPYTGNQAYAAGAGNGSITVLVTTIGTVWYSADGLTAWQRADVRVPAESGITEVIWTGSYFLALATTGFGNLTTKWLKSTDGITWATGDMPASVPGYGWHGLCSNGTVSVAFNANQGVAVFDGTAWTAYADIVASLTHSLHFSCVWTGTLFVAVFAVTNSITAYPTPTLTSPDGVTWTVANADSPVMDPIVWNGSIILGNQIDTWGTSANQCYSSTDGITWTSGAAHSVTLALGSTFISGNSKSVDSGVTWTTIDANDNSYYVNGGFVTPGAYTKINAGLLARSTDLSSFSYGFVDPNDAFVGADKGLCYDGPASKYVAVNGMFASTSTDAHTWSVTPLIPSSSVSAPDYPQRVAASASIYLALSPTKGWTSSDGVTWTPHTPIPAWPEGGVFWLDLVYNGSVFCGIAQNEAGTNAPYVATSSDGINWTTATFPRAVQLSSVAWNGSVFCGVGPEELSGSSYIDTRGVYFTSADGITWTEGNFPGGDTSVWDKIAWNGSVFLAISSGGYADNSTSKAYTSPDGATWTQIVVPAQYWEAVLGSPGEFLLLNGYIYGLPFEFFSRDNGATWIRRYWNKAALAVDGYVPQGLFGNSYYLMEPAVFANGKYSINGSNTFLNIATS